MASGSASGISRTRLSRLVLDGTTHLIELNDPAHYNGESHELLSDLMTCIESGHELAALRHGCAFVLQGVGAHFCTGGRLEVSSSDSNRKPVYATLTHFNLHNEVATRLR